MIKRLVYLTFLICLWIGGLNLQTVLTSALVTIFSTYIVLPLFYHYCSTLQRHLVFLSFVNYPRSINFDKPEDQGLPGTRNFYLETEPRVKVGIWHILPSALIEKQPPGNLDMINAWYDHQLGVGDPVLLYVHGNTSSRASGHRVHLYKVLRGMGWHIVAFDYRGYADSTKCHLSETGVVHDAKAVYRHIKGLTKGAPLMVWGHSLGTGVSCHAIADVCLAGEAPAGLILESPFNNIRDEIKFHPLAAIFRKMPKFEWLFLDPLKNSDIEFCSDVHITKIDRPILILHAEDDLVVPYSLGKQLYETAVKSRPPSFPPITFKGFDASCGYAHKFICNDAHLPELLRDFCETARNY